MRVRFVKAAAAAGLLALSVAGCNDGPGSAKARADAQLQQVTLEGKSVTASGCVRPVETTSCIVVRNPGGGYYDISTASPRPDPARGVGISMHGRDLGKNTQCGRELTDVTWSYLNIQCAAPASASTATDKAADKTEKKAG
jgi:hypothetical protein